MWSTVYGSTLGSASPLIPTLDRQPCAWVCSPTVILNFTLLDHWFLILYLSNFIYTVYTCIYICIYIGYIDIIPELYFASQVRMNEGAWNSHMGPGPFLKGPTCCSTFSRRSMSSDFDCCSLCSTLTCSAPWLSRYQWYDFATIISDSVAQDCNFQLVPQTRHLCQRLFWCTLLPLRTEQPHCKATCGKGIICSKLILYPAAYFPSIFVWIWCSTFHCIHYLIHFPAKGTVATVGPQQRLKKLELAPFLPDHQTRYDFPNTSPVTHKCKMTPTYPWYIPDAFPNPKSKENSLWTLGWWSGVCCRGMMKSLRIYLIHPYTLPSASIMCSPLYVAFCSHMYIYNIPFAFCIALHITLYICVTVLAHDTSHSTDCTWSMLNIDGFEVSSSRCGCPRNPASVLVISSQALFSSCSLYESPKGTKSNKHRRECAAVKRVWVGMNCLTSVFPRRSSSAFLSDSARPSLERDWLTRCWPEISCVAMYVFWVRRVLFVVELLAAY